MATDHGSVRVKTPCKVIGDKQTTTNLRYKHGRNLNQSNHGYPVRQDRPGLGQSHAPRAGTGEPLDLADPLRPHPAAPGPPDRRGSPAALGTPPQARDAYPRTRPPRFWPPGRPRRARRPARQNPPGQAPADPKDAPAPPHPGIPC